MNRTDLDDAAALLTVTFTPEQAAAVVMALATRPDGPYAVDGRAALDRVLDALDPEHRERTASLADRVRTGSRASGAAAVRRAVERALGQRLDRDPASSGVPPSTAGPSRPRHSAAHPAGRARRAGPGAPDAATRAGGELAPVVHLRSVR